MPEQPITPRQLGFYYALGSVGLEMVAPIALGAWIDSNYGTMPWCIVAGAVLGLVGGLAHLLLLLKRYQNGDSTQQGRQ